MSVRVVKNNLPQCAAVLLAQQDAMSTAVAKEIEGSAKNHVAVLTGALQRGITTTSGNPAEVNASSEAGGGTREYAVYNEYGTSKMEAHPFMMPAYVETLPKLYNLGKTHIGRPVEAAA